MMVVVGSPFLPLGRWDFPPRKGNWGLQDLLGSTGSATEVSHPSLSLFLGTEALALSPAWRLRLDLTPTESCPCSHHRRSQAKLGVSFWGPSGVAEAPAVAEQIFLAVSEAVRIHRHPRRPVRSAMVLLLLQADVLATSLVFTLTDRSLLRLSTAVL